MKRKAWHNTHNMRLRVDSGIVTATNGCAARRRLSRIYMQLRYAPPLFDFPQHETYANKDLESKLRIVWLDENAQNSG